MIMMLLGEGQDYGEHYVQNNHGIFDIELTQDLMWLHFDCKL